MSSFLVRIRPLAGLPSPAWSRAVAVWFVVCLGAGALTGCLVDFSKKGAGVDGGGIAECGNGRQEPGEDCDGEDLAGADCAQITGEPGGTLGCTPSCEWDLSGCHGCGNGALEEGEGCDDANVEDGDGCSSGCAVEAGWTCAGEPSICGTLCGDGLVVSPETCDDGNQAPGDGCGANCQVEAGWDCTGEPSYCDNPCGDGILGPTEDCDDGNLEALDGCDASCLQEPGWLCSGAPLSTCDPLCGDGLVVGREPCDDGNQLEGDGCDGQCAVEPYSACHGAPSVCVCVVYVDGDNQTGTQSGASWASAYARLPDAIPTAASRPGSGEVCEIWVAEGTYHVYEYSPYNTIELRDDTALYGGFAGDETLRSQRDPLAHLTRISGERENDTSNLVYHVFTASSDQNVVLDGLWIFGSFSTHSGEQGGALDAYNSTVTLRQCLLEDHHSERGGAVAARYGTVTLQGCVVQDSSADFGGGLYGDDANLVLLDTTVRGNQAADRGGGAFLQGGSLEVRRSRLLENLATSGFGGALRLEAANGLVESSVLAFNHGDDGGGALSVNQTSGVSMINCTLYGNTADLGTGKDLRVLYGTVDVVNSILWTPTTLGAQIATDYGGDVDLGWTTIRQTTYSGPGVSYDNPLLLDPTQEDFRLQAGSPCIDAAYGDVAPATDLEGLARVDDPNVTDTGSGSPSYVDRGAHERQP